MSYKEVPSPLGPDPREGISSEYSLKNLGSQIGKELGNGSGEILSCCVPAEK